MNVREFIAAPHPFLEGMCENAAQYSVSVDRSAVPGL